jgi:hypothetical protein
MRKRTFDKLSDLVTASKSLTTKVVRRQKKRNGYSYTEIVHDIKRTFDEKKGEDAE